MVTTFKVILLIAIVVTLIGTVSEKDDKNLRASMLIMNIYSMVIFFALLVLF